MSIIAKADDVNISGCTLNGNFVNWAGTNVTISDSDINGEVNVRIGVSLDNTRINDGKDEEDVLIAAFSADEGSCTIGEYKTNASNVISHGIIDSDDSPSGKALHLERLSAGTQEAGCYLWLHELMLDGTSILIEGTNYRFEYTVKGTGQWGIRTDQTGWYPCVPMADKFSTGIVTYQANRSEFCRLMLYAVDKTKGMNLEIDSIKIYEIR